jgi:ubiquinone/menaquinone biosynthesis C-methylase UbiE
MAHVCPWWLGYLLVSPLRRLLHNPEKIPAPYIREGMTVLDVGPGMGFFTIPAARMVGKSGRVIAVDVQEKMLQSLVSRAYKAGVRERVFVEVCKPDSLGVSDPIDLCLAINVMHEVPDAAGLLAQIRAILKPTGILLVLEPKGHVSEKDFQETLTRASAAGLKLIDQPEVFRSRSAVFVVE